jgi:hypothetical protein
LSFVLVLLALGVVLVAVLTGWGLLLNLLWNRRMERVAPLVRDLIARYGKPEFVLSTRQAELLVSRDFIHYLSLRRAEVEATIPMHEIESLRITESSRREVRFCFGLPGGRETRTVRTVDISHFAELFNVMIDGGKEIRYARR